jgi:predicted ABC-type ATPase
MGTRSSSGSRRPQSAKADLLVITGTMGAGKTTVLYEASDLLTERGVVHAAIDVDALGVAHLSNHPTGAVAYENLRSVCANYAAAGVERILIAEALESRVELQKLREATASAHIVVCRLTAPLPVMEERVRCREAGGVFHKRYVERVAVLDAVLDAAAVEDFAIRNEGRAVTDVAREMLVRAGWL